MLPGREIQHHNQKKGLGLCQGPPLTQIQRMELSLVFLAFALAISFSLSFSLSLSLYVVTARALRFGAQQRTMGL